MDMDEEVKRWTARRKSALVLEIPGGGTNAVAGWPPDPTLQANGGKRRSTPPAMRHREASLIVISQPCGLTPEQ